MIRLRTINSEVEIWKSIIKNFKQYRTVNQTAFYLGAGADYYYDDPGIEFSRQSYDCTGIAQLLKNILAKKKDLKVAIVSLACGSCKIDRIIMEYLQEAGYDVQFFGVDSSMAMLRKANNVLNNATFKSHLICANIGAFNFKKELDKIIGDYDFGIYLFFGNIIGNLNQNYMIGTLRNILRPGEYMLLDVVGFETITPQIQDKMLERYTGYLYSPPEIKFFSYPLEAFGVPEDCGKLTLKTRKDHITGAEVFNLGFQVKNAIRFTLERDEISLSRNEYIDLHDILVYDLNKLTELLEGKDFKLKNKLAGDHVNQLLLQRQ